jgi:hypothetical protein
VHKKYLHHIDTFILYKNNLHIIDLLMKVDNLFCFILLHWNFPNQITSYNAIDIFENLTMNRGALYWVESFWCYNAKVIDYWTIFLININRIINRNFILIQRCTWCCWKIIAKLDLMKFISYFSYLRCERYWILNEFCYLKFKQITTNWV